MAHTPAVQLLPFYTQSRGVLLVTLCMHKSVRSLYLCTNPSLCVTVCPLTQRQLDLYKSILIQLGEVFYFSNMSGVVPVTWSTQVFLPSPLIPPIILLVGHRSINHNNVLKRGVRVCVRRGGGVDLQ